MAPAETPPAITLPVQAAGVAHQYPVAIAGGLLNNTAHWQSLLVGSGKVLIVTDATVGPLYQQALEDTLRQATPNITIICHTLPVGETAKQWDHIHTMLQLLATHGFTRHDAVLALGGGVVSDAAGLVAALHHRGCQFLVAPTTLLAMVDASVGGKVAVNYTHNNQLRKNAHGTFYPPHAVVVDTTTLATLPPPVYQAGLAEVLKTALLETTARNNNSAAHAWLASNPTVLLNTLVNSGTVDEAMHDIIAHCVAIKASVVAQDPHELGGPKGSPRMWLNLGHTFAHAYETLTEAAPSTSPLQHGHAVALGLLDAAAVSVAMGWLPQPELDCLTTLHQALGLNNSLPAGCAITPQAMLQAMAHDKKQAGTARRLVLPITTLGQVTITGDVPDDVLQTVLTEQLKRHAYASQ